MKIFKPYENNCALNMETSHETSTKISYKCYVVRDIIYS